MSKRALLIFAKNPEAGKVKTRLAATIGNEAALLIYQELLLHTVSITQHLPVERFVFYSDKVEQEDIWSNQYSKEIQNGNHLGQRMQNAFALAFSKAYSNVVIIGTDCPGLSAEIILSAFADLELCDIVLGPAEDGGYYLLAMKQLHPALFENMLWSTSSVLNDTINRCVAAGLQYSLLPLLKDIDEEKDLPTSMQQKAIDGELLFVYNANSDLFSTLSDFAHKVISPSTYQCYLCALTYGNFTVKQEWKSFIKSLPLQAVFLHKDEFEKKYSLENTLPAVFIMSNGAIQQLLTKHEIESCQTLEKLKSMVAAKIKQHVQHHHTNL